MIHFVEGTNTAVIRFVDDTEMIHFVDNTEMIHFVDDTEMIHFVDDTVMTGFVDNNVIIDCETVDTALSLQALYIVGIALHEQIDALKSGDQSFQFLQHCVGDRGLLRQLESLVNNTNVNQEPIKDLLAWVLRVCWLSLGGLGAFHYDVDFFLKSGWPWCVGWGGGGGLLYL